MSGDDIDYEEYAKHWRERFKKRELYLIEKKKELRKRAHKCSELLKTRFNVKKVYLIGSLLRGRMIHENADIDLAVVGLADEDYFPALRDLYNTLPRGVDLDLITVNTATESMKKHINEEGESI